MKNKNKKAVVPRGQSRTAPVATSKPTRTTAPQMRQTARSTVVTHTELVVNLFGDNNLVMNTMLYLDPGNVATFPWLSGIATNYERYRFNKLKFEYLTRTNATQNGVVIMAVDYDAQDNYYNIGSSAGITRLGAYFGAVEGSVWQNHTLVLDPKKLHPGGIPREVQTYIRAGDADASDAGLLLLATAGCSGVNIGLLRVSYEVELLIPSAPAAFADTERVRSGITTVGKNPSFTLSTSTGHTYTKLDDFTSDITLSKGATIVQTDGGSKILQLARGVWDVVYDGFAKITGSDIIDMGARILPLAVSLFAAPATPTDAEVNTLITAALGATVADSHHYGAHFAKVDASATGFPNNAFGVNAAYNLALDEPTYVVVYIDHESTAGITGTVEYNQLYATPA